MKTNETRHKNKLITLRNHVKKQDSFVNENMPVHEKRQRKFYHVPTSENVTMSAEKSKEDLP